VLLRWNSKFSDIASNVAPDLKYLGMMLPYTPLQPPALAEAGLPLVMTSANLSEEPIAKDTTRHLSGCVTSPITFWCTTAVLRPLR